MAESQNHAIPAALRRRYSGKTRNSGQYLPLRQAQKPPCISAMVPQFDNTELHTENINFMLVFKPRSSIATCILIVL